MDQTIGPTLALIAELSVARPNPASRLSARDWEEAIKTIGATAHERASA